MKARIYLISIFCLFLQTLLAQDSQTLIDQAKSAFDQKAYNESIQFSKKALTQSSTGSYEYIQALDVLVNSYLMLKSLDPAKKHLDQWLAQTQESFPDSTTLLANVLLASGELAVLKLNHDKAIEDFSKIASMQLEGQIVLSKRLTKIYSELGKVYSYKGNYPKAEEYFRQSLEIIRAVVGTEASKALSVAYNNLAIISFRQRRYEKSIDYFKQTIFISEDLGLKGTVKIADEYVNLASVSLYATDYNTSEEYFGKAEKIYLQKKVDRPLIALYGNKGILYRKNKKYTKAIDAHQKSLKIALKYYDKIHPEVAHRYANIGTVYHYLEDYEKATEYNQKALDIRLALHPSGKHPEISRAYWNLADIAYELKEYRYCLTLVKKAWAANSVDGPPLDPYKDPMAYVKNYKQLGVFELDLILHLKAKAHHALYLKYHKILDLKLAYESLHSLIWFLDQESKSFQNDTDKLTSYATINQYYRRLIQLSYELHEATGAANYIYRAFEHAEGSKSMLLMEVIQSSNAMRFGELPDSLIKKGASLEKKIAELDGKLLLLSNQEEPLTSEIKTTEAALFRFKEQQEEFLALIEFEYPKYHQAKYESRLNSLEQIQQEVLDKETALIEYVVSDSMYFIFLLEQDKKAQIFAQEVDSVKAKALKSYVKQLTTLPKLSKLEEEEIMKMATVSQTLYQELLAPIVQVLSSDVKRLIIIPDDILSSLPFELLLTAKAKDAKMQAWPYLIREYSISYSYSAFLLLENQRTAARLNQPKSRLLAMAPHYINSTEALNLDEASINLRKQLKDLPAAIKEVQQLEKRYRGAFLYDSLANEKNFKSLIDQANILHFAMHGLLDKDEPLTSSLVFSLSQDRSEDNLLYAYEISKLNIEAQLVVLSACETGIGKLRGGEGLMSLARSFMYAGAPSLLVSLWQVNDEATSILMSNYYKALAKGLPKDKALQQAKLEYLAKAEGIIAHPTFWAAFIQLGDRSPVKIQAKFNYWILLWIGLGSFTLIGFAFFIRKRIKK